MSELDSLVQQICETKDLKKEDILEKIAAKQKELSNLVSDVGAAHIIANELGVELESAPVEQARLKLHDIMEGMNSVNLFGRVRAVFDARSFEKDGKKGKVGSFEVFDDTADLRIVLWGDQVSLLDNLQKNDIIQVKGAYTRPGIKGLEVHLGNRGSIEINPEDAPDDLPEAGSSLKKISDLTPGESSVDLLARLVDVSDVRTFTRSDGSTGKVASLTLGDSTGTVRATLWDSKTDITSSLSSGNVIRIENAYTRDGLNGTEVQLGWSARICKTSADLPPITKFKQVPVKSPISGLKDGDSNKSIRACIVDVSETALVYDFCPTCNKRLREGSCDVCGQVTPVKVMISNAQLDDGTGVIRAVFYRAQAEKFFNMSPDEAFTALESEGRQDFFHRVKDSLLGKEMVFTGYVKYNSFSDSIEFVVRELSQVHPVEEAEAIIEDLKQSN